MKAQAPKTVARNTRRAALLFPAAVAFALWPSAVYAGPPRAQIGLNFTASTFGVDTFDIPPDTMGAVGSDHIVELINGRYSVYRKIDGVLVQTSSLDDFWKDAGVGGGFGSFDSHLLYDSFTGRWFATSAHRPSFIDESTLLFAVSHSSDPTGGWTGFGVLSDPTLLTFVDFPTLGVDADALYLSGGIVSISPGDLLRRFVVVLPKADLLAPIPTVANTTALDSPFGSYLSPAINLDNTGLPFHLLLSVQPTDHVQLVRVTGSVTSPTITTDEVSVTPYPFFNCPGGRQPPAPMQKPVIGVNVGLTTSSVLRNGIISSVETVCSESGRLALHWFKIDAHTATLLQESLIVDPQLDLYYPSIAVNEFGTVVIGCNGSSPNQFVSSYAVAGNTDSSGVTSFGQAILFKSGVDDYFNPFGPRWGDYSATVVDPGDPLSFWTFQEWVSGDDVYSTQISELILGPSNVVEVAVDIKPGDDANPINLASKGLIPVAILSGGTFDATVIDSSTVVFAGAPAQKESIQDVNRDGLLDVVLFFGTQDLSLQSGDTNACLTGRTVASQDFAGCDAVRIKLGSSGREHHCRGPML